jgi:HTH-type transcriptional regulator / antitoxin HigA
MITNERQYKITRSQLERFKKACAEFDAIEMVKNGIDPIIVEAQRSSLLEQSKDLNEQIVRYDDLREGKISHLTETNFSCVGELLIESRIAKGLTQRELADRLGLKEQQVQRYEQERYQMANLSRISAVADALDVDIQVHVALHRTDTHSAKDYTPEIFDAKKLPVREMKKRGWLDSVSTLSETTTSNDFDLAAAFIAQASGGSQLRALHRQNVRAGGKVNNYAILAWKARILQKARGVINANITERPIDPIFISNLVRLSQAEDGPVRAVELLRSNGIAVVFEERMVGSHLDGAAMLLDGKIPVIGMTLRHDRLDNFWFVLLHELAHIVCHREQGLRDGFFDDEGAASTDALEKEADEFAGNALIPDEVWNGSFVRFTKSRDHVTDFAKRNRVGISVVAGRIRNERKEYSLFTDLIGQGVVKRLIADAGMLES